MRRNLYVSAALLAGSIACGLIGWSGHVLLLPTACVFPFIWAKSASRRMAAATSAGYFLAASRGLPLGVATYYHTDVWPGLLLWFVASGAFVFVHTVLWTKQEGWERPLRYLVVCIVMSVPPFGILGWAHPLTAAGVLFPKLGWGGLIATAASLSILTTRHRSLVTVALGGFWLWSAAHWTNPILPAGWYSVDLREGASLGRENTLSRHRDIAAILLSGSSPPSSKIALLPESALGFWTPTTARFWQRQLAATDLTVVAGATVVGDVGYDNVLIGVSKTGSSILYRERMPVPGSMWQPWRTWSGQIGGARAYFFANPIIDIGGYRAAPLICYEQLLVWPILQSALHDPNIIIAVGNGWWTAGTSIVQIQKASTQAWALLFDKPLALSFNT
ncbi:conjugal transfer protein TraB [Rhizobium calliandrae]|uniref:Conjugal transfer protein TraB n=1 Tax=Rhizobium calliandrae TaxID=1312182 RepID=A0ABT7KDU1_9HYPH|nr:conjugal transfer protein TraB [Rhizobium calliandrae]MDL2406143.1 conjugal transfer protein TraB [Rhizobium calliandrae]